MWMLHNPVEELLFWKDGVNMNTIGSSGVDIISGGSGSDTIKGKKGK